jgi:hypothetical protein
VISKNPPYRSAEFLRFAHELGGGCCFARDEHHDGPVELHHYGDKGMGQKASDLLVARVCRRCHGLVQGKRSFRTFERAGLAESFPMMLEDNVKLLAAYVQHLEQKGKRR